MPEPSAPRSALRPVLLRELRRWHWMASAVCFSLLVMFAATGLALNHAGTFGPEPKVRQSRASLPAAARAELAAGPAAAEHPIPPATRAWLAEQFKMRVGDAAATWSAESVELVMQRPGAETVVTLDRAHGDARVETEDRGLIAAANDLHTGRYTPRIWNLVMDVFAVSCLLFAGTGLGLLLLNARARPVTLPLLLGGAAVPLLIWALHAL